MLLTALCQTRGGTSHFLCSIRAAARLLPLLIIHLCFCTNVMAQVPTVTYSGTDAPLKAVFTAVESQTGYVFFYDAELLKLARPVTITSDKMPVNVFLQKVFADQPLEFHFKNKTVSVTKKELKPAVEKVVPSVPFVIQGMVYGADGPLMGTSVTVKSSGKGTTVNQDGKYSIQVVIGDVLIFSFLGYQNREMLITENKNLSIRMAVSESAIQDVVVTGMFNRRAETYTGSTTTFSKNDLLQVGAANVLQSLRNLEPSMMVVDNNAMGSDPNTLPDIQIRGQSGLPDIKGEYTTNPNLPLFILDGSETTLQKVVDLDINRVKSITILKDAASKAIYGSRAANGVVVVETERPQAGKLRLSYNNLTTLQVADVSSYNLTNAREKLEVELAGGVYTGVTDAAQYNLMQEYNKKLALVEKGVNTDWLSKPLRNGLGQRHSVRIEGGDLAFRYGVDLMYINVKGVMKGSDRNTVSGSVDLNYRVKGFTFSNILTIADNKGLNSRWGAFSQYAYMNPYLPYYDENGKILKEISNFLVTSQGGATGALTTSAVYNPAYNSTLKGKDQTTYTDITNNLSLDWTIRPGLRATSRWYVTKQVSESDLFKPADHTDFMSSVYSGDEAYRKGNYKKGNGKILNYTGNVLLGYFKKAGQHLITVNGGGELNSRSSENVSYTVEGFPNDRLDDVMSALQYMKDSRPTGNENTVRDISLLFSGNYSFKEKYLADVSYRATRSSQLGANNPWGNLWSLGIGWNLHNEAFLRKYKFINRMKVRASTGYTGTQSFSSYISLATYTYVLDQTYDGGFGTSLVGLSNPDLGWQRRQDNNLGVDLQLFSNLNIRFDYYVGNTAGFVTDIAVPPSNGFSTFKANLGNLQNKGFDFRLDYRLYYNNKTRSAFSLYVNVSRNKNILKKLSNSLKTFNAQQDAKASTTDRTSTTPRVRFVEGQSISTIWAVKSLGIDPATGREVYLSRNGEPVFTWDAADQVAAGDQLPKFNGNFGFNAAYKGFNLTTAFRFQYGGQTYNNTLVDKVENADIYRNVDRRVFTDRWRKPGDVSYFKDIALVGQYTQLTTRFVEDDNKLTFAALNLTYDFERVKAIKKLGLSRLRIGFNTAELFTLSTVRVERGTSYPFARSYNFTLSASF